MGPNKISKKVIADRLNWVDKMVRGIRALPLENYESFIDKAAKRHKTHKK